MAEIHHFFKGIVFLLVHPVHSTCEETVLNLVLSSDPNIV